MSTDGRFTLQGKRVWVAGHRGMVGAALVRRLSREPCEILTVDRQDVDLVKQAETRSWVHATRPDAIILAAAKVGGILANDTAPADFLADNLQIELNVISAARAVRTSKVLFLGSSCIYPRLAPQPIQESALLTGPLEPTNEWYAIAKIAGLKLIEACRKQDGLDFISAMPTNLYGPEDNFDLKSSHVLPALIRRAHEAKTRNDEELVIWGTGTPLREFLHVDDCADALVLLLQTYSSDQHINVGSGEDLSILDLARLVADVVGFKGRVSCDTSKPDGTPRKLMSIDRIRSLGWSPKISLQSGISETYSWFLAHKANPVTTVVCPVLSQDTDPRVLSPLEVSDDPLEVVLINYGLFNSNSGGHTACFANALSETGARVTVIGFGDPESVKDFGQPKFATYTYADLAEDLPPALLQSLKSRNAIIHAWTPRELVRDVTERLIAVAGCPYVVHLEDNEEIITSSQLGISWAALTRKSEAELDELIPSNLSHPTLYKQFLAGAAAITVITDSLRSFIPNDKPVHLLEPGVDTEAFNPDMSADERAAARSKLYIDPRATVLVYHGNMHAANRREIFSLYTALAILRRRGHNVILIRAGKDFSEDLDVSMSYLRGSGVINLGYLDRQALIGILKLADVFVQPGSVDEFNQFRLPSKVPEFLALGRPVIIPRTNIGLKLEEGVEALLLDRGDGSEIADKVEVVIRDSPKARKLGSSARSYAIKNLNWNRNAQDLAAFYRSVVGSKLVASGSSVR